MAARSAPSEGDVLIDGRRIHYVRSGAGDRVFVLVHGYAADHTTWMFTEPALRPKGVVYAIDLPGHGGSSLDVGSADVAFFAGIVRGVMDEVGIAAAHVVGHSLGAAIAVEVATRSPERASALTLIAPAGFDPWINAEFIALFPTLRDTAEARRAMEMLVADPRMISPEMLGLVLAYTTTPGVTEALETIAAASFPDGRQRYFCADRLADLAIPISILWGGGDRIVHPVATGLPAEIPVHVIPKAGHLVHLETPQRVNRLIAPG
jgi:pyruvate dehydrogenase E2 component (dihydrolipoamide acetyltransferase)